MDDFGFQWHITDRCNQRCAHCYQEGYSGADEPDVARLLAMAERVLGAIPERPVSINVTGGEPLLYPQLAELFEGLHRFANLAELNLITNGTVIPEQTLDRLSQLPAFRYLKVSLESGDPLVNDAVRGRGHLGRMLAGLPRLRWLAGDRPVVAMVTLGRHNVASLPATVEVCRQAGMEGIIFERFVPLGQGVGWAGQVLDSRGWRAAVEAILAVAELDAEVDELLPYRGFWLHLDPDCDEPLEGALCNLGEGSMALMPDGTVHPCRRLPLPLGNVMQEPFLELLARLASYAAEAQQPRLCGPRCGRCGVEGCAGCRALTRAVTGELWADDPQCWWSPRPRPRPRRSRHSGR